MKKKGFTLVELLVVIAIIALLMGILMPALARVRQIAFRMVCGTNLSGIGKAMLIYANDYEDELPRAGGRNGLWVPKIANWAAANRVAAYGANGDGSITSCFYLLVKYAEVTPKSFLCKGDSGVSEFKPADEGVGDQHDTEESILWGPYDQDNDEQYGQYGVEAVEDVSPDDVGSTAAGGFFYGVGLPLLHPLLDFRLRQTPIPEAIIDIGRH